MFDIQNTIMRSVQSAVSSIVQQKAQQLKQLVKYEVGISMMQGRFKNANKSAVGDVLDDINVIYQMSGNGTSASISISLPTEKVKQYNLQSCIGNATKKFNGRGQERRWLT